MEDLIKVEIKLICCEPSEDEINDVDRMVSLDDWRKIDLNIDAELTEDDCNKLITLVKDLGATYECLKVGNVRPFVITAYDFEEAERINNVIQDFLEKVMFYKVHINIFYGSDSDDNLGILDYNNVLMANIYDRLLYFLTHSLNILNIINPIEEDTTKYICIVCSNRKNAQNVLLEIENLCEEPEEKIDSVDADINYIADQLESDDLFLQLAEEAAELSQACLKYVRAHKGNNPTKDSEDVYLKNILEELTDVRVSADALNIEEDIDTYINKIHRWADRIRKKNGGSAK